MPWADIKVNLHAQGSQFTQNLRICANYPLTKYGNILRWQLLAISIFRFWPKMLPLRASARFHWVDTQRFRASTKRAVTFLVCLSIYITALAPQNVYISVRPRFAGENVSQQYDNTVESLLIAFAPQFIEHTWFKNVWESAVLEKVCIAALCNQEYIRATL